MDLLGHSSDATHTAQTSHATLNPVPKVGSASIRRPNQSLTVMAACLVQTCGIALLYLAADVLLNAFVLGAHGWQVFWPLNGPDTSLEGATGA